MGTFNDHLGAGWNLTLTLGNAEQLRAAGLDLFHPEHLERLLGHPLDQARAIALLTEPQARALWGEQYSPERYGEHLFGHFDTARAAWVEEIKRFFRCLGRHNAAAGIDRVLAVGAQIEAAGLTRLAELAEIVRVALESRPPPAPPPGGPTSPSSPPSPASPTGGPSVSGSCPAPPTPSSGPPGGAPPRPAPSSPMPRAPEAAGGRTTSTPTRGPQPAPPRR